MSDEEIALKLVLFEYEDTTTYHDDEYLNRYFYYLEKIKNYNKDYISKDKIKEKLKELEEQKEKLKYDGNRCFADYEQFCKNLKFFKEQIEELLEENTNE